MHGYGADKHTPRLCTKADRSGRLIRPHESRHALTVMARKTLMNPVTLKTIINNAPLILQGANKLVQMIRDRNREQVPPPPAATLEDLDREVRRLEERLQASGNSDLEQVRLIEELARQNETLAESLRRAYRMLTLLTWLSGAALIAAAVALALHFLS